MTSLSLSNLPPSFKTRVINTFGEKGEAWLANLPDLITECEDRFNVKIGSSFPHLTFNYTAEALQSNGVPVIVKLCVPTKDVENEINALKHMRGEGIVNLLDSDSRNGILLLEKLESGERLSTLSDDATVTAIAADVMKKIWKPISGVHDFPTTVQWFSRLDESIELPSVFSAELIDKAKRIAAELHQNMGESVLLHGDLHHFNILSSNRQPWIAIDPKGVIGEREYDVGALLRNPLPDIASRMDTKKVLKRRVDQLSELLSFDREKIRAWGFAQAVLAAVWCVDSKSDDWTLFLTCVESLSN